MNDRGFKVRSLCYCTLQGIWFDISKHTSIYLHRSWFIDNLAIHWDTLHRQEEQKGESIVSAYNGIHTRNPFLPNPRDLFNALSRNPLMPHDAWLMAKGRSVPLSKSWPLSRNARLIIIDGQLQKQWTIICVCVCVCMLSVWVWVWVFGPYTIYSYLEHVRGTCNANEAHFNLDLWP